MARASIAAIPVLLLNIALWALFIYFIVLIIRALRKYLRSGTGGGNPPEQAKNLGEALKGHRTSRGYTQEYVAEALGVSRQAVSKWENGKAMPEIPMLCEISRFFNCSADRILDPSSCVLRDMGFNYEFLVKPRIPVADYSGSEWPKSISFASLLTAVKLFFGLEERRDTKGRQINDDEEYILQSAFPTMGKL